jgi:hypothetical protein
MAGVATADVHYDTSFDGGAHFDLRVTLAPAVTNDQGAAVAHTFVDRMIAADFAHFDVVFDLKFRRPALAESAPDSRLATRWGFHDKVRADPSAQAVADGVVWWLDVARSPAVDAATVSLPLDDRSTGVIGPNLSVQVPVTADDAALAELIRAHPQLNSAQWTVPIPAPDPINRPNTYQSVGLFPDRQARETWQRITTQLTRIDSANASTQPDLPPAPKTVVTVGLGFDFGRQDDFERIARGVAPLLSGLPLPVVFRLNARVEASPSGDVVNRDLTVTIGGCTQADPKDNHPTEPLEAELRQQYEKC